jgi:non-ribosomal peptide synthetase component F
MTAIKQGRSVAKPFITQEQLDDLIAAAGGVREVADIYPISPLQQGLLFHSLYAPESTVYVMTVAWQLTGALDVQAFASAWRHLVERHALFRTAFVGQELAVSLQVVRRKVTLPFEYQDWRDIPAEQQEMRFEALHDSERQRGFDFAQPPLMRILLIRTQEAQHRVLWSHHHALLDGWSVQILLNEMFVCYRALSRGQSPQLPPARPYRDYIAWLQRQDLGKAEAYWRDRLQGFTAPTQLQVGRRLDGRTLAGQRSATHSHVIRIKPAVLESFARSHKLTVNTLLLGAWSLLLSRYSGSPDVVFGVTISGRPTELTDAEKRVGLFINTLPLRAQIESQAPVLALLQELQVRQSELIEYQYASLVDIQRWSELPAGQALFETAFVFQSYPTEVSEGNVTQQALRIANTVTIERPSYSVVVRVGLRDSLFVNVIFDDERLNAGTVERLVEHFEILVAGIVADASRRCAELPLLSATERKRVLVDWSGTANAHYCDKLIHVLFAEQALRTPNATAVVCEDRQLSYAELERRSNQLAHHLQSLGVGPDVIVGLCVERSLELVIGLLGILKAGGAYLPLDPQYPAQRLAAMLEDARPPILLTQESLADSLPVQWARLVHLDGDWPSIAERAATAPVSGVTADNLAYVIYTSGSTGAPKGVLIRHDAIGCSIAARLKHYEHTVDGVDQPALLLVSSCAFDSSIAAILWALLTGARLVVARAQDCADPNYLCSTIDSAAITHWLSTTSLYRALLEYLPERHKLDLRCAIVGGEALHSETVTLHASRSNDCELHQEYGPTEATIWSTVARADRAHLPGD